MDPSGTNPEDRWRRNEQSTTIDHFSGAGEDLSWADEGEGKYTREIPAPTERCRLPAKRRNAGELQMRDLQGNVIHRRSVGNRS